VYRERGYSLCGRMASAGAFLFFLCSAAHADTIFTDFGAGDSSQLENYCVFGATPALVCSSSLSAGNPLAPAALFMSTGNYDLTQLDLGLTYSEGTNSAVISLFTDVGGAPGVLLDSWSISNQPASTPPVTTISGITGITLLSGDNYFLQVSPGADDTQDGWSFNNTGATGTVYDPPFGGSGLTLPAFDVLGTPVATPEPGQLAKCAAALLGLMALRRVRRASTRG
jgi:hypothetical protein